MLVAQISYELPRLSWSAVIDILAVAFVLYQVLQIVRPFVIPDLPVVP